MELRVEEIRVEARDRLWPGSRRVLDTPAGEVLVLVTDDGIHAIENSCPHYGAALDRGRLSYGYISCPWHDWLIDVKTGACMGIARAARTFETIERDGVVYVVVPAETTVEPAPTVPSLW